MMRQVSAGLRMARKLQQFVGVSLITRPYFKMTPVLHFISMSLLGTEAVLYLFQLLQRIFISCQHPREPLV